MFSTSSNLALVAEAPTLYMDGNFQICPRLFYHIFTIHASKHGQQFPMVYFLLPSKSQEVYNTAFILLKEAAQNIGTEVNPPRVLTDFKLALQQSVAICFPQAERKGCLFHFAQAICARSWTEGWHLKVRKLAGKVHPNIYEVVSLFKMEQAATEVTLMQVAAGELPVRKRRKYRNHKRRLVSIKEK